MGQLSQKWAVINKMWAVVCKPCTACCCAWQPQTDPSGRPFWHFRNNSLGTYFKWMHDSNTEGNASIVRSYVTSAWMHQLPSIEGCCRNVLPPPLTPKSGSQGWAYFSGHWPRGRVAPGAGHGSIIGHTLLGVSTRQLQMNVMLSEAATITTASPRPLDEGGSFIITGKWRKYNICFLPGHGTRHLRYIYTCGVLFWKLLQLGQYLSQRSYLIVGLSMIFASILSKLFFQPLMFSAASFFPFFLPLKYWDNIEGGFKMCLELFCLDFYILHSRWKSVKIAICSSSSTCLANDIDVGLLTCRYSQLHS